MSKRKKKNQDSDLLENPEVLKEKLEGLEYWFTTHPKFTWSVIGAIVLLVGGYFGYRYYFDQQNQLAQKEMFQAVRYFESDSLSLAMNGDGNNLGFSQIVEDYSMTKAGNLAHYYIGFIQLKDGKFEEAIDHLKSFSSDDILIQARAYSLIGDAYMEQKDYENASEYYGKAANHESNKFFSPVYLMKKALAHEKLNQIDQAKAAYQRIIDDFGDAQEVPMAKKYKAMLEPEA